MAVEISRGAVFMQLAHGVVAAGLVFLVLEVYQLRVAVENSGLGSYETQKAGSPRWDGMVNSIAEPLQAIARRLDQVSDAMARPVLVAGGGGPGSSSLPADAVQRPRVVAASDAPRQEIPPELHTGLASLVTAIRNIEKRPKVTGASIPKDAGGAKAIDVGAVKGTIAQLRGNDAVRSQLLLLTTAELLRRYGKPTFIGVGSDAVVNWTYETAGSSLVFNVYDGRVTAADSY